MHLVGYLGMFRKSQEVRARNFDPKGGNTSRKPNPATLCPPPLRVIGLSPGEHLSVLQASYILDGRPTYKKFLTFFL